MSDDTERLIVRWPTNGKAARSWIEALKRYGQLTISIERADNLVAALEAAEAQRDTLDSQLAQARHDKHEVEGRLTYVEAELARLKAEVADAS